MVLLRTWIMFCVRRTLGALLLFTTVTVGDLCASTVPPQATYNEVRELYDVARGWEAGDPVEAQKKLARLAEDNPLAQDYAAMLKAVPREIDWKQRCEALELFKVARGWQAGDIEKAQEGLAKLAERDEFARDIVLVFDDVPQKNGNEPRRTDIHHLYGIVDGEARFSSTLRKRAAAQKILVTIADAGDIPERREITKNHEPLLHCL
jgi:hypothetical protein